MHRQQAIGLLLQPLLSLLMLAVRTMPVSARSTHPVLMMALMAFKDHMSQLTRATALNRAEHFALLKSDLCCGRSPDRATSALLKKFVAMLPQTVGDSGHGREITSAAQHRRPLRAGSVADDETTR